MGEVSRRPVRLVRAAFYGIGSNRPHRSRPNRQRPNRTGSGSYGTIGSTARCASARPPRPAPRKTPHRSRQSADQGGPPDGNHSTRNSHLERRPAVRQRHGDGGDDRHLPRPADDLGIADRRARGHHLTRGAAGAAHASCFSMACSNILAKAGTPPTRVESRSTISADKLEAGWTVTAAAIVVRGDRAGRDPGVVRGGRGRGQGRLPDLAGPQGQRRDDGRGDARGLSPAARAVSRSSAAAAGCRP